jgi:FtsP/CotA-like multicopper oxidase with cupredoxin domain
MSINFPARRGTHFTDNAGRGGPTLSRRNLIKLGAGSAAAAAAAYGLDRTIARPSTRPIATLDNAGKRPVRKLSIVGTDGWVSFPKDAAPAGDIWPDKFAPTQYDRDLYVFGFAVGGRFDTPNRLQWADVFNGEQGTPAARVGGLAALKNRANFSAPILYYHEGDDIRITLWTSGMGNRPDIVDPHTLHWHGFPNQIPYFDGVPNDSLAVPIGSNLVYRYLPYHGMAGSYMWHCHVSDAEHVQMGLQGIVFIRPYQNYGTDGGIPQARATGAADGPLGYIFNDGVSFAYIPGMTYPAGSTAYDREFAFILDEIDARVHWDDAHLQEQDFSEYAPKFATMNGRSWPDTIAPNWDYRILDPDTTRADRFGNRWLYNVATEDQATDGATAPAYLIKDTDPDYIRLGSQPWSSLIQANAGETICLRFSNLGYQEHSMQLTGLPFLVMGEDAKNLLDGRDGYEENPNPNDAAISPLTAKRSNISFKAYSTALGPAESRDLLVKIPLDAQPTGNDKYTVFEFFDRNDVTNTNSTSGQQLVGGMRTRLHVFRPGTLPPQQFPQQIFNPGAY